MHHFHLHIPPKSPFKFATLLFVATARQNKFTCSALTLIATLPQNCIGQVRYQVGLRMQFFAMTPIE